MPTIAGRRRDGQARGYACTVHILLTNDDGLRAPGIEALYTALADPAGRCGGPIRLAGDARSDGAQVIPIAPLTVQSATSHGVTFHEPLMVKQERLGWGGDPGMTGIAVDGRPADCVKLAVSQLWPERFGPGSRPDLLISGINAGANAGINVIYSGTVAAALEGAFLGIPAIAVSLHMGSGRARFDVAAARARHAIEAILGGGLPERHACLSVNIPITQDDGPLPAIRVCPMNTHGLVDAYERRVSPAGDVYYWATGRGLDFRQLDEGSDVAVLLQGAITVTPLRYDLTKKSAMERWRARLPA